MQTGSQSVSQSVRQSFSQSNRQEGRQVGGHSFIHSFSQSGQSVSQSVSQGSQSVGQSVVAASQSVSHSVNHAEVTMSSFMDVFFTDPPDAPYMTVVPCVMSLNVTWRSSVEASIIRILDYRIKLFDAITLKRVRQFNGITSSSKSIGDLKRNRTYIVIIQARNEVGYGKSANTSATTLLEGTTNHSHLFHLKICAA